MCDISNNYIISYDVCSLYTNIPLNETLNLAVDFIFKHNPTSKNSKKELMELFTFCTSKTNFLFGDKVYDHIDGIAVGLMLAPTLTNVFMGYHERNWIENFEGVKPLFYRHYVDNIFVENQKQAMEFFEYINQQHSNINFTKEVNKNGKLAFLDVLINNCEALATTVYHKPMYTGLFLNFCSFVPFSYETMFVKALLNRILKINIMWLGFDFGVKKPA